MPGKHCDRYWEVFSVAAQPLMNSARHLLSADGLDVQPVSEACVDGEKSLGFVVKNAASDEMLYVDMWLLDGEERDFGLDDSGVPKVGVNLSVTDQDGVVKFAHTPHNYSASVGVSGSLELLDRVNGSFNTEAILEEVRCVASGFFMKPVTDMAHALPVTTGDLSPVSDF